MFKYMPGAGSLFHYRYLDVSTLKELARRWKPEILDGFKTRETHQAMDDIRESVAELAYYRGRTSSSSNAYAGAEAPDVAI